MFSNNFHKNLEPVFISARRQTGEGFSLQTRRFDAGILCVCQGKATKYGGKRPARMALSACEYRFFDKTLVDGYTGMSAIIKGSSIMEYVEAVWGCEFIEDDYNGKRIISEIGYSIDNTSKTRALFEINKGIPKNPEIDVNSRMPEELRRVHFKNMIYIAD